MTLESVRAVYPLLVQLARDLSQAAKDRRTAVWVSYDDFCQRCKEVGNLIRPSDGWWEVYVTRGEAAVGDVQFWFRHFQAARDYPDWPEAPFF
jgi:hypothetical protein